ncbi:MAG: FGGY-family carbohydrate kinase, partial [Planctomycetota bacterium]
TGIWREVLKGLTLGASAVREAGCRSATVGVDSWAVDGTFVGPGGELLGLPHAYRDPAHAAAADAFVARHPGERADLFRRTGLQHQPFNTIFQLEARRLRGGPARGASDFLLLPDLLHFWLTGIRTRERTNASTTGLLRAADGTWDGELLDAVGAPREAFGPIIEPGTTVGPLLPGLIASCGLPADTRVVAPATHDTASAVVGVPIRDDGTAYLSSGTWSLLGLELDGPVLTEEAMRVPFTNEAGVGGRVRFLKNIAGLWLIQELRRDLERLGERFDFASLAAAAERSEPWRTLIDPDAADLAAPGDSVAKLRAAAGRAGEPTPDTPGRLARCCLDSLALAYADTVDLLQRVSGREVGPICVVGGG